MFLEFLPSGFTFAAPPFAVPILPSLLVLFAESGLKIMPVFPAKKDGCPPVTLPLLLTLSFFNLSLAVLS